MKPLNQRKAAVARRLSLLWYMLGRCCFKSAASVGAPASVIIFDFHLIGDIVLLLPLLRQVRESYSGAHIALVAGPWSNDILKGTGCVDEIISFSAPWVKYNQGIRGWVRCVQLVVQLRKRTWDLGIEVRGDVRQILLLASAGVRRRVGYDFTGGRPLLTDVVPDDGTPVHLVDYHRRMAEYLGIWPSGADYVPSLTITGAESEAARQRASYIGFHFGASLPLRRFPQSEALKLVVKVAAQIDLPLVLFVSPDDPRCSHDIFGNLPPHIQARTELWSGSLRDLVITLSHVSHVYCMDSATAHIAVALGLSVTVFFGPAISTYVRPIGKCVTIAEKRDLVCKPCDQRHCINETYQCCLTGLVDTLKI